MRSLLAVPQRLWDRIPVLSPQRYERVTLLALVLLFTIVLTGAAVRLTGSGLGCTNWPRCDDSVIAPLELNAWIEFGNRLVTGLVGIPCIAAFVLAWKRSPRRRDLLWASALLPFGVLGQAVLGGLTVLFEIRPGFVMGHFLLSMLILAAAVNLYWRARHERDARPVHDRRVVLLTRALLVWGGIVLFAGTFATAAGPHPGADADHSGAPVHRITFLGLDEFIHWHGRTGTVLGLLAVGTWLLARRTAASYDVRAALTAVCVLVAAQGVIGFVQYELELPAGIVWVHVAVASATWVAILFAVNAAGRLGPRTSVEDAPPVRLDHRTSVEREPVGPR